jgi:UDP-N-acetylmuramyl pentapeptide phosphotransferase/UDP-N-acetylglucosamine-1-phosphate transferase
MWLAILVVAASIALSGALIALLQPWLRCVALARPNARSSHKQATPQGGGIAVILATVVVSGIALAVTQSGHAVAGEMALVFAAAILLAVVGGLDDVRNLPVLPRLLAQSLAVAMTVAALHWSGVRIAPILPVPIELALLFVAAMWFVNLFNFMDGVDWMAVAETVPVTTALAILSLADEMPPSITVTALALLGAMIGFAPFNKPVARLFLGDVGSLPIGLLLFWLLAVLAATHPAAAILLPLYYVADATLTLLQRAWRRERIWEAHRAHYYQRAVDGGMPVPTVIARVFALNLALGLLAVMSAIWVSPLVSAVTVAIGLALVGGVLSSFARKL